MTPAISVRNISKCYKLGVISRKTLVDEVRYWWAKIRGRDPREQFFKVGHTATENRRVEAEKTGDNRFWALKDVSFDVQPGEVVGIIGKNGTGKSTLLKILTRITEPTKGEAVINGRVGSLLEVGTGFHPELTGRENIYMNGTILGMKKREVNARFDEIVAFSEIERFIDTPVKRYSSGMYVRLAFAVAAHLDPEIMLVDEVLAVGDIAFQKKCLGKMEDVAKRGRTVLFVSHNMASVNMLCSRGILLDSGFISVDSDIDNTITYYLESIQTKSAIKLEDRKDRGGKGETRLIGVEIAADGSKNGVLRTGNAARFEFKLEKVSRNMALYFTIYNFNGQPIANFQSTLQGLEDVHDNQMGPMIACDIDELILAPGQYRINVALFDNGSMQDHIEGAAVFNVEPGTIKGRAIKKPLGRGDVCIPHRWHLPF